MASFFKKCKRKFEFFDLKFKFHPVMIWQNFFISFIISKRKFWWNKLVKRMLSNFIRILFFGKRCKTLFAFFCKNLAISGPGKYKIWNLDSEISTIWALRNDGIKSLIFPYANFKIHWNLLGQIMHSAI